jgi:N-acyl homoserine lactone hydrolase
MKTRLFVLDLGRMKMDHNLLVEKMITADVDEPNRPNEMVEFPISAFLFEHGDNRILYDTGCNPEAMGPKGRWPQEFQKKYPYFGGKECQLPNRLKELGLGPEDISLVVLSHMHNDHAGCVEYFSRSRLLVHENEFSAAMHAYVTRDYSTPFIWEDTNAWISKGLKWELIDQQSGDIRLNDSATILNFGSGHSYGMLGLYLDLPKTGSIILCSDAVYCGLNFGPPSRRNGVVVDSLGWDRTVRRIRELAIHSGAKVWFGHDADQFAQLIKSDDGCYE